MARTYNRTARQERRATAIVVLLSLMLVVGTSLTAMVVIRLLSQLS